MGSLKKFKKSLFSLIMTTALLISSSAGFAPPAHAASDAYTPMKIKG